MKFETTIPVRVKSCSEYPTALLALHLYSPNDLLVTECMLSTETIVSESRLSVLTTSVLGCLWVLDPDLGSCWSGDWVEKLVKYGDDDDVFDDVIEEECDDNDDG